MITKIINLKSTVTAKSFYEYVYNDNLFMTKIKIAIKAILIEYGKVATEGKNSISNTDNISISISFKNKKLNVNVGWGDESSMQKFLAKLDKTNNPGQKSNPRIETLEKYVIAKKKFFNQYPHLLDSDALAYPDKIATVREYAQGIKAGLNKHGSKGGKYIFSGIHKDSNEDGKGIIPIYKYKSEDFYTKINRVVSTMLSNRFDEIDETMFNEFNLINAGGSKYLAIFNNGDVYYKQFSRLSDETKKRVAHVVENDEKINKIVTDEMDSVLAYANNRAESIRTNNGLSRFTDIKGVHNRDYRKVINVINNMASGQVMKNIERVAKHITSGRGK